MFGTANPINEIGPQYAVVIPVNNAVITINEILTCFKFSPNNAAFFSPNTSKFNGFIIKIRLTIEKIKNKK
jgi:hypothetical protein